jgi:hypothetical protein
MPATDPDDSGVVQAVSGNGFQIVDEAPTWTVPSFPFQDHTVTQPIPFPEWATDRNKHMFNIEGKQQFHGGNSKTSLLRYGPFPSWGMNRR